MISSGSIEPELQLTLASPSGRWVLAAAVLGSAMASLDATVVNVALPAIGRDLQASFEGLQWVITGYTLTLASFILVGGALGDRFGRRRVFTVGTVWFAGASTICALAPSTETLVAARAFQGIGAALLTPGSLAMIQASFTEQGRGKAIGAWSAFGGAATAIGPFLGGYLVQGPGWRWVFLINVPVAAIIVAIAGRHVPESRDPHAPAHLDLSGAALGALGMAGVIYALIGTSGGASITTFITLLVGIAFLAAFVVNERRSPNAMIPSSMLQYRQFNAANIVTFALYAALSGLFFLLAIDLQVVAGFSPVMAGTALLPITGIMLVLSSPVGDLATRTGPRLPMSLGPLIAACGVLLLLRIGPNASYVADVLPAVTVFGFGIALLVAPLTIAVLGAVPAEHAGVASGMNNAVARTAGVLAVAVLPLIAGISGDDYQDPLAFAAGFRIALFVSAVLLVASSLIAAWLIRDPRPSTGALPQRRFCAIEGPPLQPEPTAIADMTSP